MLGVQLLIEIGAVLRAPIGVMYQRLIGSSVSKSIPHGTDDGPGMQAFMHMMADYFARERISDQTYVSDTLLGRQIGYIRHPDLFRAGGSDLVRARLEPIRMSTEAMMTIGSLVISAFAWNQLPMIPQNIEQPISAYRLRQFRFGLHKAVQLAGAQPGHFKACLQHKPQHLLRVASLRVVSSIALVIRLP